VVVFKLEEVSSIKELAVTFYELSARTQAQKYSKEIPLDTDKRVNETADPQTPYVVTEKRSSVETLLEIVKTQADTIKQQQETIHFLTTNQGNVTGGTAASSM